MNYKFDRKIESLCPTKFDIWIIIIKECLHRCRWFCLFVFSSTSRGGGIKSVTVLPLPKSRNVPFCLELPSSDPPLVTTYL